MSAPKLVLLLTLYILSTPCLSVKYIGEVKPEEAFYQCLQDLNSIVVENDLKIQSKALKRFDFFIDYTNALTSCREKMCLLDSSTKVDSLKLKISKVSEEIRESLTESLTFEEQVQRAYEQRQKVKHLEETRQVIVFSKKPSTPQEIILFDLEAEYGAALKEFKRAEKKYKLMLDKGEISSRNLSFEPEFLKEAKLKNRRAFKAYLDECSKQRVQMVIPEQLLEKTIVTEKVLVEVKETKEEKKELRKSLEQDKMIDSDEYIIDSLKIHSIVKEMTEVYYDILEHVKEEEEKAKLELAKKSAPNTNRKRGFMGFRK